MSGSNETVVSSRIPSTKESVFRRPLIPQTYHKMGAPEAFKTQLDVRLIKDTFIIHNIPVKL